MRQAARGWELKERTKPQKKRRCARSGSKDRHNPSRNLHAQLNGSCQPGFRRLLPASSGFPDHPIPAGSACSRDCFPANGTFAFSAPLIITTPWFNLRSSTTSLPPVTFARHTRRPPRVLRHGAKPKLFSSCDERLGEFNSLDRGQSMTDYRWTPIEQISDRDRQIDLAAISPLYDTWRVARSRLEWSSPSNLKQFTQRLVRRLNVETGILERLYDLDRGTTEALIANGFVEELVSRSSTDIEPSRLIDIFEIRKLRFNSS